MFEFIFRIIDSWLQRPYPKRVVKWGGVSESPYKKCGPVSV